MRIFHFNFSSIAIIFILLFSITFFNTPGAFSEQLHIGDKVTIKVIKGDHQLGITNYTATEPIKVKVTDSSKNPIQGKSVFFSFIKTPSGAINQNIESPVSKTDEKGIATTKVRYGAKQGQYIVAASCPGSDPSKITTISLKALGHYWLLLLILGMIGGLGLFLHGMKIMGDGVKDWGGDKLKTIMTTLTKTPVLGVIMGILITTVFQSSSATTVTLVGFTNAGLCKFSQILSVCLGANIGATTTGQLVAFKLTDYALIFIGIGFFLSLVFSKNKNMKSLGEVLLGFGLLFLGLKMMSLSIAPIKTHPDFISLLQTTKNPYIAFFYAFIFTSILQSSGTTSSLVITFAAEGLIDLQTSIPLLLGANVGTCITSAFASIGTKREAKRIPVVHYIFNILTALIMFAFIDKLALMGEKICLLTSDATAETLRTSEYVPRQIANVWTLIAIFGTLICLPFLKIFNKLVLFIIPDKKQVEKKFSSQYLDSFLLNTPDLALQQVKLEISRMFTFSTWLYNAVLESFRKRDAQYIDTLINYDEKIDILEKSIKTYITKLAKEHLTDEQTTLQMQYLLVANELESMGDVISKSMLPQVQKIIEKDRYFSEEGWSELREYHAELKVLIDKLSEAFRLDQITLIEEIIAEKNNIVRFYDKYHLKHMNRILSGVKETHETTSSHLDILSLFRRMHVVIINIAFDIYKNQPGDES